MKFHVQIDFQPSLQYDAKVKESGSGPWEGHGGDVRSKKEHQKTLK